MIFLLTIYYPSHTVNKIANKFKPEKLPDIFKRWQIYTTAGDKNGMKAYHLIMSERGKSDEALIYIQKGLVPFFEIEGYEFRLEILMGLKDSFGLIGK